MSVYVLYFLALNTQILKGRVHVFTKIKSLSDSQTAKRALWCTPRTVNCDCGSMKISFIIQKVIYTSFNLKIKEMDILCKVSELSESPYKTSLQDRIWKSSMMNSLGLQFVRGNVIWRLTFILRYKILLHLKNDIRIWYMKST